ncbi:hypothetical protein [Ohtaekwangia koreensis]|uniref:Uncharacterized protein n=1 Tax=Ohtaekwangia koreensis TaxID=688867 RepID=A0A1T5M823_9BACT|nr:hypothetical protein [Ohtaekwangia koreensis]SKC84387.1 hypothetical protein SAMN05660236_4767 [Ohtaekwangia koreensis]
MDKSKKKEILNKYKKDELEKLSQSDNKILSDFAKNKLGLKSDRLSLERLKNIPDDKLIATITEKINEVLETRYKNEPKKYKNADNVIPELNESLRAIHFTCNFEMYVVMGDNDKFFTGATSFELTELINGYRLLRLEKIADKIYLRTIDDIEKELSEQEKIKRIKIEYIRGHLKEFELN